MYRTFDDERINAYIAKDAAFFKIKNSSDYPQHYFIESPGVGLFIGTEVFDVMHSHAYILPKSRGKAAVYSGRQYIDWVFNNTNVSRIETRADKAKKQLLIYNALLLTRKNEDGRYVYYEALR